jgi:hypothetical protein
MKIDHNNNNQEQKPMNSAMPQGIKSALAIGTLVSVLIAFNQCTFDKKTNSNLKRTTASTSAPATNTSDAASSESEVELPEGLTMPPENKPTAPSELDTLDVGVKNFEQIYRSMASMTGVDPANTTTANLYNQLVVQLPADNNIKSFLPANQVAITKMAAEFCEILVENAALRVVVWPTFNFAQTPTQGFNSANKQLIINQAISRFLPPLDATNQTATSSELSKLFDELLVGENLASNVTTRKIVKAMCISTLSSAHANLL